MKVGIQTWGTEGDLVPFAALAIGLRDRGHDVTLAYSSVNGSKPSDLIDLQGVQVIEAHGSVRPRDDIDPYALSATPGSFREYSLLLKTFFDPFTEAMFAASDRLCAENDIVLGHAACHTLMTAAEIHGKPRISVVLTPLVIRSKHVSPLGLNLGPTLNSLQWWLGDRISTWLWFDPAKRIRKARGLPPVKSLQNELFTTRPITLVAASGVLTKHEPDRADHVRIIGQLQLPISSIPADLPLDLRTFLSAGDAPVYMTFGSCTGFDPERAVRLMVDAAMHAGVRAIIRSDMPDPAIDAHPDMYRIGSLPHQLIFPHCSCVVHHGGAGTSHSVVRAGKPSVVVSHGFDQGYWAKVLQHAGVAGPPLKRNGTNAIQLADAIRGVLETPSFAHKAEGSGALMRAENGVQAAVDIVEWVASTHASTGR